MYLRRVAVRGFRSAATDDIVCEFPGRFSLLIGSNNAGKTTIADALYLAHPHAFPRLPRPSVAVLGRGGPREIGVDYAFSPTGAQESTLGQALRDQTLPEPVWVRQLERNLGQVRARTVTNTSEGYENLRLIYLPAHRNPLDELARREAQILVELLRAQQQQERGHRNLVDLRNLAAQLLENLTKAVLIDSVEKRVRTHLTALSGGVSAQYSFVGGQYVDDAYLARVLDRRGHNVTAMVSGIEALASSRPLLLDGELVAGAGRASDFYALAPRLAGLPRRSQAPLSFWAFDLLWLDGDLLIDRPFVERRAKLEALSFAGPCGIVPRFPGPETTTSSPPAAIMTSRESCSNDWPPGTARGSAAATGGWSRPGLDGYPWPAAARPVALSLPAPAIQTIRLSPAQARRPEG